MTKPISSTSNLSRADWRFSKPLVDIDLSAATAEIIADLSVFQGKFSGLRCVGYDIGYASQSATNYGINMFVASAATSAFAATQDIAVFGRVNTSSAATGLLSGSGTGPISITGIAANFFASTATGAAGSYFNIVFSNVNSSPSFVWDAVYSTTGNTVGVAYGGGRFFATVTISHIRIEGTNGATGGGQRFHKGRFQIFGLP